MSDKRRGPLVTVQANCYGCEYVDTEHYRVQSDSGCDVYCNHPDVLAESLLRSRKRIGDTNWDTPKWCPLLPAALAALKESP